MNKIPFYLDHIVNLCDKCLFYYKNDVEVKSKNVFMNKANIRRELKDIKIIKERNKEFFSIDSNKNRKNKYFNKCNYRNIDKSIDKSNCFIRQSSLDTTLINKRTKEYKFRSSVDKNCHHSFKINDKNKKKQFSCEEKNPHIKGKKSFPNFMKKYQNKVSNITIEQKKKTNIFFKKIKTSDYNKFSKKFIKKVHTNDSIKVFKRYNSSHIRKISIDNIKDSINISSVKKKCSKSYYRKKSFTKNEKTKKKRTKID